MRCILCIARHLISIGRSHLIELHRYCVFYKLKVLCQRCIEQVYWLPFNQQHLLSLFLCITLWWFLPYFELFHYHCICYGDLWSVIFVIVVQLLNHIRLCDLIGCSMPVFHCLPEFAQIHIHWVGNAIYPLHPLPPPSPFAFKLSRHQGLFQWVSSSHLWYYYHNFWYF